MARISNSVLGKASGKIGNFVIRNINGKTFLCDRPVSFKPGTDIASINRREKFAILASFAKAIASIPALKSIWKSEFPNSSPFNSIIKILYPFFSPSEPSEELSLTPAFGFVPDNFNQSVSSSEISCSFSVSKKYLKKSKAKYLRIHTVLFLSEPLVDHVNDTYCITLSSDSVPINSNSNFTTATPLDNRDSAIITFFFSARIFSVITLLDENSSPISNSQTLFLLSKQSPK